MSIPAYVLEQVLESRRRLERFPQLGFPIVDGIYWDSPSPGIGALFLMQLMAARQRDGIAQIDLRFPADAPRSLSAVVAQLRAEHREGFWYRGQRARRSCVYRGAVPRMEDVAPGINPITVQLEALIPSAFRSHTGSSPANWKTFKLAPALDYFAGPARAIFESGDRSLGELLLTAIDHMVFDVIRFSLADKVNLGYSKDLLAPGVTTPHEMLDLISIAQHYEYRSIMVDVSSSIDAATWFATRDWSSGAVAGSHDGSPGVIYRIDAHKVLGILDKHINGPGALAPEAMQTVGMFGLSDISERFELLQRPRAQEGGSLLGMENVVTHFLMHLHDAMTVFSFDHASVQGSETPLTRNDICPPGDRGDEIFRPANQFSSTPIEPCELQNFLYRMDMPADRIQHLVELRREGVL